MLQRAASNAYSWWWASHIRTKQSKWLEQSLQDMEEKVQTMLQLIEEDGDSFAKRAEMYYKRRPELISTVEESYKTFRSLADRYDLLSKELQNANHTIATVFPEQVQFGLEEPDEDCPGLKFLKNPQVQENGPNIPRAPAKDLKRIMSTASNQFKGKKSSKKVEVPEKDVPKSGLTKEEALKEIDKLQKDILALQTVKEFVKSSYETGLAKYWDIENQIMEMQQKVCGLQDEFDVDSVIEDDEARTLMAEAALKSCQETLAMLQEKQEKATKEAREEYKRIEAACQRLRSLRQKYLHEQSDEEVKPGDDDSENVEDEIMEHEKTKDTVDLSSIKSFTVSELADKIDQLVNKVISLETAVSSQTVLVHSLRTETDDLNVQIQNLEDEKETLVDETKNLGTKVKEMEEKLNKIQGLNKNVRRQNSNLQTNFAVARTNLDRLSEKLSSVKPDEEEEETNDSSQLDEKLQDTVNLANGELANEKVVEENPEEVKEVDMNVSGLVKKEMKKSETFLEKKFRERNAEVLRDDHAKEAQEKDDEDLNWQQLLLSGMEDREKILLKEYTVVLRNYKELKRKLSDTEKKERDKQFDITLQMRELKKAILKRDEEIHSLHQKLNSIQGVKDTKEENTKPEEGPMYPDENEDVDHIPTPKKQEEEEEEEEEDDEVKLVFIDRTPSVSAVEEKLRRDIDAILDENLDFWLRFSTAFHEIQKFRSEVQDLQDEILKLKEKKKQGTPVRSEARPIYKHLREIQTELNTWLAQSVSLKDELKGRFASLCTIQEEITKALKEGVEEDEIKFSSHQAAKFQGEVLNMKQENNKVREELQAGLDHVATLQVEIEKTLRKLNNEFGISSDQPENLNRPSVPLKSFIFGTKPKKPKHSIFSCMHPTKGYQVLRDSVAPPNS